MRRLAAPLLALLGACHAGLAPAQAWLPSGAFLQYAETERDTRAASAGVTWPLHLVGSLWGGELGGYWEVGLGHWSYPAPDGRQSAVATQLAVKPTLRWRPDGGRAAWFAEAAIGLTVVAPVYENREKRFSTAFNFGDHLALGWSFGPQRRHELALRFEHLSNGGLRKPNPGENFWQLRYAWRWS